MFDFINRQTQWYNDKSKALINTVELAKRETPIGQYKYLRDQLSRLYKARHIIMLSIGISNAFGMPSLKLDQATDAMIGLIDLQIEYVETKIKNLQGLWQGKISLESRTLQGMYNEGGYTNQPNQWQNVSDLQRQFQEYRIINRGEVLSEFHKNQA